MHQARALQLLPERHHAVQIMRRHRRQQPQVDHRADQPGRHRGVHHVADVLEQVDAHDRGGNARGVRDRRHLVAEEGPRDDGTRRHGQIGMKGVCHAHEGHADRGTGGQAAAQRDADHRAERKGREIEVARRDQPEAVIHQRGDGTADHQRRDQQPDEEEEVQRPHALPNRTDHPVLHGPVAHAPAEPVHEQADHGCQDGHVRHPFQPDDRVAHQCHDDGGHRCGLPARHLQQWFGTEHDVFPCLP